MLIRANDEEYAGNDDSHPPSSQAQLPPYVSPLLGRGQGSAEGLRRRGNRGRVRFDAQRSGEGVQRLCRDALALATMLCVITMGTSNTAMFVGMTKREGWDCRLGKARSEGVAR